jgi:hypothetical protein
LFVSLSFLIRAAINPGLEDLILAFKLVLIFILKLPHFVRRGLGDGTLPSFEGGGLICGISNSFGHVRMQVWAAGPSFFEGGSTRDILSLFFVGTWKRRRIII